MVSRSEFLSLSLSINHIAELTTVGSVVGSLLAVIGRARSSEVERGRVAVGDLPRVFVEHAEDHGIHLPQPQRVPFKWGEEASPEESER